MRHYESFSFMLLDYSSPTQRLAKQVIKQIL
jgi:hypothetical protein